MRPAAIPTSTLLSKEAVSLGEFTTSLSAVQANHCVPDVYGVASPTEEKFQCNSRNKYMNQTRFSAALSSSISATLFRRSAYSCSIAADYAKWYRLPDITTWFKQAMESERMKEWIQDQAGSNQKIYMITGIQTLMNPQIEVYFSSTKQRDAALRLSPQLPPNFEIIQPAINGGGTSEMSSELKIAAAGEKIFALEYHRVTFKWLRRLSSNSPQVSNNTCTWTCLDTTWRGDEKLHDDLLDSSDEESSGDESDSAIEVTLETERTLPGKDWVEENTENGSYCISTII